MSRFERLFYCVLAVALPANLIVGAVVYTEREDPGQKEIRKLNRVVGLVRELYVDGTPETIGYENLFDGALNGLLQHLDEHSAYFPPKEAAQWQALNHGEYEGIGIELTRQDERLTVVDVMPGAPAAEAGVLADDQFVRIDGRDATQMTVDDAVPLIKGKPGTLLKLRVYRPARHQELELTVVRRPVALVTVRRAHFLQPGIAYLHISLFNEKTARELVAALQPLRGGMRGLILDLRDNPGGVLESACEIASLFLPEGALIVTTKPRQAKQQESYYASPSAPPLPLRLPVVLLINRRSASAAEVLSGCLQDHRRALLVGERSYGKASVQMVIPLPEDNSSIKLTTSYYATPSGRRIHGVGIAPDVEVKVPAADELKLLRQLRRPRVDAHATEVADPQLARALALVTQALAAPAAPAPELPAAP